MPARPALHARTSDGRSSWLEQVVDNRRATCSLSPRAAVGAGRWSCGAARSGLVGRARQRWTIETPVSPACRRNARRMYRDSGIADGSFRTAISPFRINCITSAAAPRRHPAVAVRVPRWRRSILPRPWRRSRPAARARARRRTHRLRQTTTLAALVHGNQSPRGAHIITERRFLLARPMYPSRVRPPGKSPFMDMQLVPVYGGDENTRPA